MASRCLAAIPLLITIFTLELEIKTEEPQAVQGSHAQPFNHNLAGSTSLSPFSQGGFLHSNAPGVSTWAQGWAGTISPVSSSGTGNGYNPLHLWTAEPPGPTHRTSLGGLEWSGLLCSFIQVCLAVQIYRLWAGGGTVYAIGSFIYIHHHMAGQLNESEGCTAISIIGWAEKYNSNFLLVHIGKKGSLQK